MVLRRYVLDALAQCLMVIDELRASLSSMKIEEALSQSVSGHRSTQSLDERVTVSIPSAYLPFLKQFARLMALNSHPLNFQVRVPLRYAYLSCKLRVLIEKLAHILRLWLFSLELTLNQPQAPLPRNFPYHLRVNEPVSNNMLMRIPPNNMPVSLVYSRLVSSSLDFYISSCRARY